MWLVLLKVAEYLSGRESRGDVALQQLNPVWHIVFAVLMPTPTSDAGQHEVQGESSMSFRGPHHMLVDNTP